LGFPLGTTLKTNLSKLLWRRDPDRTRETSSHYDELRGLYQQLEGAALPATIAEFYSSSHHVNAIKSWRQIAEGLPFASSVDNFIFMQQKDDELIRRAKAAICLEINVHEIALGSYVLNTDGSNWFGKKQTNDDPSVKAKTAWTQYFSEICFSGVVATDDDIADALKRLKIISFNYDRCVEEFVTIAVQNLFGFDRDRAARLSCHLKVIHPYGSLGDVRGIEGGTSSLSPFGVLPSDVHLGGGILTFSEFQSNQTVKDDLKSTLAWAKRIVFLGFGFHAQNMELLDSDAASVTSISGTAFKMSEASLISAKHSIVRKMRSDLTARDSRIVLKPVTCAEYLESDAVNLTDANSVLKKIAAKT
jgi:hypothetical protein